MLDLSKIEKIRDYIRDLSIYLARFIILNSKKNIIKLAKQYKKIATFVDNSIKNNLIRNRTYQQNIQYQLTINIISTMPTLTNLLDKLAKIKTIIIQI